jgi:hypothetical protein
MDAPRPGWGRLGPAGISCLRSRRGLRGQGRPQAAAQRCAAAIAHRLAAADPPDPMLFDQALAVAIPDDRKLTRRWPPSPTGWPPSTPFGLPR